MILIPDGVILIPQRSPKGRLLSATFLNMLLVPIFTDVGQILLQPTPSSVWRGASKRMRRPRSARIGGNTREGGGQLGVGAAPPRQQGARPPSQSFSLLARKVQRPQSWRRVTPAFATFTTCCSGSLPRQHVARQNTHEATFCKTQSYGPSTDYQALRRCWWWIIWDC